LAKFFGRLLTRPGSTVHDLGEGAGDPNARVQLEGVEQSGIAGELAG
jgi:hypothetical protein